MGEKNDNWFGSWLNAAKNKSTEVLEFVKKDLGEFGSVVKNEASNVVNSTSSAIGKTLRLDEPESTANSMKRSISSILGQMNQVLNPSPDDSDTEAILITEDCETVTLTKLQKAIYTLQKDDNTFLNDPDLALQKQYNCWLEIVDDEMWSEERTMKHLSSSVVLKNQYEKLVPTNISHTLFWKRYLFKKALIEDDIAQQDAQDKRVMPPKEETVNEDNVKWDQEDFAKDIELTEEQQLKLLEQYEEEIKQKKIQKTNVPNDKVPVGENVIFDKKTAVNKSKTSKKNKQKQPITKKVIAKSNENKSSDSSMSESNSLISLETTSSKSSTDDDWEKISDTDK